MLQTCYICCEWKLFPIKTLWRVKGGGWVHLKFPATGQKDKWSNISLVTLCNKPSLFSCYFGVWVCINDLTWRRCFFAAPLRFWSMCQNSFCLCFISYNNELQSVNTFTAIVDLSRSNFSIARSPLFQLKSAM